MAMQVYTREDFSLGLLLPPPPHSSGSASRRQAAHPRREAGFPCY